MEEGKDAMDGNGGEEVGTQSGSRVWKIHVVYCSRKFMCVLLYSDFSRQ